MPNPWDEISLEVALTLRDRFPDAVSVTACSVGAGPSARVLREFLACGADRAVHIEEADWEPDTAVVARHLAACFQAVPFDLGLFGARDLDTGSAAVGSMFSVLTGVPHLDGVVGVRWAGEGAIEVSRRVQRATERVRVELPACLGILRGPPLRYPTFWGKRFAEEALIPVRTPGSPGHPLVERLRFSPPKPRKRASMEAYLSASGAGRVRQAFGLAAPESRKKDSSLLTGSPQTLAGKIIETLKQEKLLEIGAADSIAPTSFP
jgi:hypothetical protein